VAFVCSRAGVIMHQIMSVEIRRYISLKSLLYEPIYYELLREKHIFSCATSLSTQE
jgi:hypothetical protein